MAITVTERAKELLRNQAGYAGTDLPASPVLALIEELVAEINTLRAEVDDLPNVYVAQ